MKSIKACCFEQIFPKSVHKMVSDSHINWVRKNCMNCSSIFLGKTKAEDFCSGECTLSFRIRCKRRERSASASTSCPTGVSHMDSIFDSVIKPPCFGNVRQGNRHERIQWGKCQDIPIPVYHQSHPDLSSPETCNSYDGIEF